MHTKIAGTTFADNAQGILIDEGSSYNTFTSCTVQASLNDGINIQPNGGGTVGNSLVDTTVERTGAAGVGAIVVVGNDHELSIQNLTTTQNELAGVYVNGATSVIQIDGWTSVDDSLKGASVGSQGVVAGTSTMTVTNAHLSSSIAIPGEPIYFEALSTGSTLILESVVMAQIGGAGAANQIAVDNSNAPGAVVRLRDVTTIGPLLGGAWAAGEPSLTYVLEDVDFSSATFPFNIALGGLANFGTFTANGSTQVATRGAFSATAMISFSLASNGSIPCDGLPNVSAPTIAGTFFTTSSTPNCNSTYNWRVDDD
jgi:hypothetical protein